MEAMLESLTALKGKFTENSFLPIKEIFTAFEGLDGYLGDGAYEKSLGAYVTNMDSFATGMTTAMANIKTMAEGFRDQAVQPLLDMVDAYAELQQVTGEQLGEININRMLEAFGNALAINDANITVEREQIKVNIKLNVIMRTKDVAESLLEGEFVQGTEKGLRLLESGKAKRAMVHFKDAVAAKPARPEPYVNLGWCAVELRQYLEAERQFRRALSKRARFADGLYGLAFTYQKMGRNGQR